MKTLVVTALVLIGGCVSADYTDPSGRHIGFARCLLNDKVGSLKATTPDGATLELSNLESNVDVQFAHEVTAQMTAAASIVSTATGHGPLPIPVTTPIVVPATQPAK
jgi:hypothetical protein